MVKKVSRKKDKKCLNSPSSSCSQFVTRTDKYKNKRDMDTLELPNKCHRISIIN